VTSIFQRAMGVDFAKLHPELMRRFSVGIASGTACVATGIMSQIWHGSAAIRPLLRLGASRHILFPEQGRDIQFTMENWPYLDRAGRETVTFNRTFELPRRRRRFDATMVYDEASGRLIDYLGTHQHVAADLAFTADDRGGLVIRSARQRFRMAWLDIPVPPLVTGEARVCEWYDDVLKRFHIEVRVSNRWLGPLFGYRGTFDCRYISVTTTPVPAVAKPVREEHRV
jgi:hypothetical protein